MTNIIAHLHFERKRMFLNETSTVDLKDLTDETICGRLLGAWVVVRNARQAHCLHKDSGDYGSFIGQRMSFVNRNCFIDSTMDDKSEQILAESKISDLNDGGSLPLVCSTQDSCIEPTCEEDLNIESNASEPTAWLCASKSQDWLFLSLIEALYLFERRNSMHQFCIDGFANIEQFYARIGCDFYTTSDKLWAFVKRYVAYRHFRDEGWVVRDGISFATHFLLYREGVRTYHASAAVYILQDNDQMDIAVESRAFGALQRELNTCKKSLMLVHFAAEVRSFLETHTFAWRTLDSLKPIVSLAKTWNPNCRRMIDLDPVGSLKVI